MKHVNENRKGYKKTPLGWIPEEWEVKNIGKLTKTTAGGTPSTKIPEYWGGNIRWMNSGELNLKKVNEVEGRITEQGLNNSSTKMIPANCVLIGLAGQGKTRGTVAINMIPLCTNQSIAAIFPSEQFDVYFLYYYLDSRYLELRKLSTGDGGRGGLNLALINSFLIPYPKLKEQKAISAIFRIWDTSIEKTQKLIEQKEKRKKALMQQLLTGKKRLKSFDGKWEKYKMKDVFERIGRKNSHGNKNVVTVSAQRGFVKQTEFFNKTIASESLDNYFVVNKGEFCYNKSYSNGYPWGAIKRLKEFESAVVTTLYICFAIKNRNINSGEFFEHYFELGSLDKGLTKIAHEGGRAHGLLNVTPSDFFGLEIFIPAIDEQIAIANIINASQKEIDFLSNYLELLKKQKKSLMQSLLTGKIRIN